MRLKDCRRFAPALFLAGAWFTYPALWIGGSCFAEFRLFGHAALALAAILLLTLDPERLRRFFVPLRPPVAHVLYWAIPGALAMLFHYYHSQGDPVTFLDALYLLAVPLAAAVWSEDFRRPLLFYLVLLGAAAGVLGILGPDDLRKGIANVFARKGEAVVASNIAAFDAGLEESKNVMK